MTKSYKFIPSFLILPVIIAFIAGCATAPKTPQINPYGNVTVVELGEVTDPKTAITSIVEQKKIEVAARSVTDDQSEAALTPQLAAEVGIYFGGYDVNDTKGILLTIPNTTFEGKQGSDLWIYKNGKTRLTKTNYYHNTPSYSDDGSFVLFSSKRGKWIVSQFNQDSYIWRMRSNGAGGMTRIGSPSYEYYSPSYSSDQSTILCEMISLRGNDSYIWYMEGNGSLPTQLTLGKSPKWLNEDTITYSTRDEITGRDTIWTCKIDGSMPTQVIADPTFDCIQPAPHPHGKYIAFVKQSAVSNSPQHRDVYVYDVESGLIQQVTTNESRDDLPNWSDDGSMLYFRSSRGINWNVWRVPYRGFQE